MSRKEPVDIAKSGTSDLPDHEAPQITRRTLLATTGAVGATLAGGLTYAAAPGHNHADHAPKHPGALEAANDCSEKGRLCLAHCLVSFQEGDTTLATCAKSVSEMLSLCDAFAAQVVNNSKYIEGIADVCRTACADCEKECRKHEEHIECKAWAQACADLVDQIKLVFGLTQALHRRTATHLPARGEYAGAPRCRPPCAATD